MGSPFAPFFTSNEADIVALEGLYVKERNPPAGVKGVNLNAVAVGGVATRGPTEKVVKVTSEARFISVFGRDTYPSNSGVVFSEMWKYLLNKRFGTLYVVRVKPGSSVKATLTFGTTLRVDANGEGAWGNDLTAEVKDATDGDANHFNLQLVFDGKTVLYKNLNISTGNDNLLATIGDDDSNLVTLTKLTSGRPTNAGPTNLATGANGSLVDADFTGAGKVIDLLSGAKGPAVVNIAGRSNTAIKDALETKAGSASDRMFLMSPDSETVSVASAVTEANGRRSDRIVYCFNSPYTTNPESDAELVSEPHAWMASIFSQTDVNDHVGQHDNKKYLAGIRRLYNPSLERGDFITLKAAGICGLGEDDDGFTFVSGVTTSLTPGKEEIARRRCTDFLQLSLAAALKPSVKKTMTLTRRKAIVGTIKGFLQGLKAQERIVADFSVDGDILNTQADLDAGIYRVLVRVKLIGHILSLVLETEIGTAVNIQEVTA